MAACSECEALEGKTSDIEPHPALKVEGKNRLRAMGNATGHVELYECLACGTRWGRDMDGKDPGASWYKRK